MRRRGWQLWRRRWLLWVLDGAVVLSLLGLYLLSSPVDPGPAEITVDGAYVISLVPVAALSDAPANGFLAGNYTGHAWPGNLPEDELAQIEIAADHPRVFVLRICSHEVRHFELEQQGVPAEQHHTVMTEEGTNYAYPWNWKRDCLRLVPHIVY